MRTCYVCAKGVPLNDLGFYPIRHERCQPGGARWREWYLAHPEKQTATGKILYDHAMAHEPERKERLARFLAERGKHESIT